MLCASVIPEWWDGQDGGRVRSRMIKEDIVLTFVLYTHDTWRHIHMHIEFPKFSRDPGPQLELH